VKRRFNFTGRQRIPRDRVVIGLTELNDGTTVFDALFQLEDLELPPSARVFVEAYHGSDLARYDFGRVGYIHQPTDTTISHLGRIDRLHFRVKVVSNDDDPMGLILATADGISPVGTGGEGPIQPSRRPILPVLHDADLGKQVWKLAFTDTGPQLLLNSRIVGLESDARSDPRFFFFVYPAVVREVLTQMCVVSGVTDPSDPPVDWHSDWLKFAKRFSPNDPPDVLNPEEEGWDQDSVTGWIDDVVEAFAESRPEDWDAFLQGRE